MAEVLIAFAQKTPFVPGETNLGPVEGTGTVFLFVFLRICVAVVAILLAAFATTENEHPPSIGLGRVSDLSRVMQ
jgi:hypothetical protein